MNCNNLFMAVDFDTHAIEMLYAKSEKTRGVVYYLYAPNENGVPRWKYGKTKNIEWRINAYNLKGYNGDIRWFKVNHYALREYFIHMHPVIKQMRKQKNSHGLDEHVYSDCYDIVHQISHAEIWHDNKTNAYHGGIIHCGDQIMPGDDLIKIAKF